MSMDWTGQLHSRRWVSGMISEMIGEVDFNPGQNDLTHSEVHIVKSN